MSISTAQHELINNSHVFVFEPSSTECEIHTCQFAQCGEFELVTLDSQVYNTEDARVYYSRLLQEGYLPFTSIC